MGLVLLKMGNNGTLSGCHAEVKLIDLLVVQLDTALADSVVHTGPSLEVDYLIVVASERPMAIAAVLVVGDMSPGIVRCFARL